MAALPLIADRVALPKVAGEVDLLAALPPDVAAVYSDPAQCLRLPEAKSKVSAARVFASRVEYIKLLRRMVACNMISWFPHARTQLQARGFIIQLHPGQHWSQETHR